MSLPKEVYNSLSQTFLYLLVAICLAASSFIGAKKISGSFINYEASEKLYFDTMLYLSMSILGLIAIIKYYKSLREMPKHNSPIKGSDCEAAPKISLELIFHEKIKRLEAEASRTEHTGGLNLFAGTLLALSGIGIMIITVVSEPTKDLINHHLPRILIAAMIEIYSFFFLKLYKESLEHIKYIQNEITNIQFRYSATALIDKESKSFCDLINNYLATERNFILKKGQTTTEIEKDKNQSLINGSLMDTVSKLINEKGKR